MQKLKNLYLTTKWDNQNEIITLMTKLKEQNKLLSSLQQNVTKLRSEAGIYLLTAFRQIYLTFVEKP